MSDNHPIRRITAAAMLAAAVVSLSAGCSDDSDAEANSGGAAAGAGAGAGGAEPKTLEAAKLAAQTTFERFSGGDFAGAWEMYSDNAKKVINRDDYVKLNETCARKGLAITLTSARMEGPDRAVVIARQLVAAQSYVMVYQGNAWRLEPTKEGLALYSRGLQRAIATQKAAGACANA